jgi:sugar phosphate isomerase/epimerase
MKFAICNETFRDWPLDKALAFAAECGYTGIEFAPFTLASDIRQISASQRSDIRRLAHASGLQVVGLHWLLAKTEGLHLTSPDPATRRRTTDYLGDLARLCHDLGGWALVFGSPQQRNLQPGVSLPQAHDYAAEIFTACLPVLEETGTTLAVEPLRPEDTSLLSSTAEAIELVERIGSPHCRLHLDCRAMSSESTPIPSLIERYRDYLVHFHVNDANGQGPGFGKIDFRPILQALGRIDYRGWVSVEVFDYAPGVERLAGESIEYLRECLDAIAQRHPVLGVQELEERIE